MCIRDSNDTYPVWSPDSKQLAYIRIPNMNNIIPFVPVREGNPWSIRTFDIQSGKTKELWKASAGKGSVFLNDIPVEENLLWWCAGDQLIFPYEKNGWQHLYSLNISCLLYTSDAADERSSVDLGGRRII